MFDNTEADKLRQKLPAGVGTDFSDDEIMEMQERAVKTRAAVEYLSDLVQADPGQMARVHKGALVLVLEMVEAFETTFKTLTRNGTVGADEITSALDAQSVDGFLNSL